MSPTPHPPSDRIVAFGLGRLTPEDEAEVAEHLEACGVCAGLLDALPADGFVAALRGAADPGGSATTADVPPADAPTARHYPPGEAPDRPDEPAPPAVPGYEVLGVLGRGGMGVVYKARQVLADRVVALKVIRSGADASADEVARFRTEAAAVARLAHPNVVPVFEVGEHAGLPFFSLQFCPGGTLAERLAGNPLPPRDAAGVAAGVEAAHRAGVVHRDLKPANVLLQGDRGQGTGGQNADPHYLLSPVPCLLRSPTSGWPGCSTPGPTGPGPGRSWGRRATCPRSRPPGGSGRSGRRPTCGPSGRSCTSA